MFLQSIYNKTSELTDETYIKAVLCEDLYGSNFSKDYNELYNTDQKMICPETSSFKL